MTDVVARRRTSGAGVVGAARHRAVLVLRYYEGVSELEIAATLGIAPGSAVAGP